GPGGVAIIVDALTDNRNRTASEVRAAFTKMNGNLGESGSVSFMFDRLGRIEYPASVASEEAMFDAVIEAGGENCESSAEGHVITCATDALHEVLRALEVRFGESHSAKMVWLPKTTAPVDEEQAKTLLKLIDLLEDNDDVQDVTSNFEVSEDILMRLSA
ncbi:MAG: YebC/PmpR family DNA-binding transcriptional regulator, partial [Rickettsiales bacterium]|nr:YebC/PmpR family DNA-binding transcriptional regulator [Rickettsiales bacterium]